MAKHEANQSTNIVKVMTIDAKKTASHKRRLIWLSVLAVASVFYTLDISHTLVLGFIFQHVTELVLTSGVCKFIGE